MADEEHENVLHATITDYPDTSVGECIEIPLIVEGKTDEEIIQKMRDISKGYFEVFPEKKQEIMKKRSITISATF
jgi:hypothetical protein